jgi:hypothetical protein
VSAPRWACFRCGFAYSVPDGYEGTPKPETGLVCVCCGTLYVLDENLQARAPTEAERRQAESDPGFQASFARVAAFRAGLNGRDPESPWADEVPK